MDVRKNATEIVRRLVAAGYIAYFAGGWVRDYVMKRPSEDIDIATDAPPQVVQELFKHTIPLGLEFGMVIVVMNGHNFEVTTFRRDINYENGRKPQKIELSTPEEDALRRDFTINGMFYDPLTDTIYDYVNGMQDIQKGIIRTIGDPHERFTEDRLRMIRAVRFASRFDFAIDDQTQQAIAQNALTLFPAVAMERVWQEFNKMVRFPRFDQAVIAMHRLGLLPVIFPELETTHVHDIQRHVDVYQHFSLESPVILYLMELFPKTSLNELLQLCRYLKASGEDLKQVEYTFKGKQLLEQQEVQPQSITQVDWVYFYADRFFTGTFQTLLARYPKEQRDRLYAWHMKQRDRLMTHIQRITLKKPLVTATLLQKHGIQPGILMGTLLKLAENLVIEQDLQDGQIAIALLKKTPYWPQDNIS